jgi:hypothetical protein
LTLGGAFDEAGDIHKLDSGRDNFGGVNDFGQNWQLVIGDFDNPNIGVNGTKRIIAGVSDLTTEESIKQSGFANVRETDDSDRELHLAPLYLTT